MMNGFIPRLLHLMHVAPDVLAWGKDNHGKDCFVIHDVQKFEVAWGSAHRGEPPHFSNIAKNFSNYGFEATSPPYGSAGSKLACVKCYRRRAGLFPCGPGLTDAQLGRISRKLDHERIIVQREEEREGRLQALMTTSDGSGAVMLRSPPAIVSPISVLPSPRVPTQASAGGVPPSARKAANNSPQPVASWRRPTPSHASSVTALLQALLSKSLPTTLPPRQRDIAALQAGIPLLQRHLESLQAEERAERQEQEQGEQERQEQAAYAAAQQQQPVQAQAQARRHAQLKQRQGSLPVSSAPLAGAKRARASAFPASAAAMQAVVEEEDEEAAWLADASMQQRPNSAPAAVGPGNHSLRVPAFAAPADVRSSSTSRVSELLTRPLDVSDDEGGDDVGTAHAPPPALEGPGGGSPLRRRGDGHGCAPTALSSPELLSAPPFVPKHQVIVAAPPHTFSDDALDVAADAGGSAMPAAPGGCGPTPPAVAAAGCRAGGRAASPAVPAPHVTMTQGSLAPHAVYSAYEPGSRGFSPPAANRSLSRLTQASQSSRIMLGSLDDGGGHALHAAPLHTVNSSQDHHQQQQGRGRASPLKPFRQSSLVYHPYYSSGISSSASQTYNPATSSSPLRRSQSQQHRHVPTPLPSDTEPWNPDDEPSTGPSAGCSSSAATAAAAAAMTSSSPVSTSDAGERAADFAAANILISLPSSAEHDPEEGEGVGDERATAAAAAPGSSLQLCPPAY